MIPGRLLHRVAALMCSPRLLERRVEPAIADFQNEYIAGRNQTTRRRIWRLLRGYAAVFTVMTICALELSIAGEDDRRAVARTFASACAAIVGVGALLLLPPLASYGVSPRHLGLLIPQAFPVAVPIGLTFGIAVGLPGRVISHAVARIVVLVAVGASLVSLGTIAWAMPAANQAFREEMAVSLGDPGPVQKGPSELTLSEVRREMIAATASGVTVTSRRFEWNFHMRLALSAANVVLVALFVVGFRTDASVRVLLALLACIVYWALLWAGEWFGVHRGAIHPFAAAWLPNSVFAALAVLILSSRSPHADAGLKCG